MKINHNFAKDILKKAILQGADCSEVYILSSESFSVDVKEQKIEKIKCNKDIGYSVRVIKNNSGGFSYSTVLDEWKEVVEKALNLAKFTKKDEFLKFADHQQIPFIEIYDPAIEKISEEEAIKLAMLIESEAFKTDSRVKKIRKSSITFENTELLIMNSKEVYCSYKGTLVSAEISLSAEEKGDAQMGWGYSSSRRFSDIKFQNIGKEAAERALRLLGAKKALTTIGEVLLENNVVVDMLSLITYSFLADNIQKGKSLLVGKLGNKVFSDKINIIDDALVPWGIGSRPFDAEAMASKKTILVEKGIIKGFLYNIYTSRKDGVCSTANAVRHGIYTPPSIGISNLFIEASSKKFVKNYKDLIKDISKGIIVTDVMGMHTANPITGEFSLGATGLWVEKGEIKYPVKETVIAGNIHELFNNVVALSERMRFYGKIGAPDILIEKVNISG